MSDEKIPVHWCREPDTGRILYGAYDKVNNLKTAANLVALASELHVMIDRLGQPIEDPLLCDAHRKKHDPRSWISPDPDDWGL